MQRRQVFLNTLAWPMHVHTNIHRHTRWRFLLDLFELRLRMVTLMMGLGGGAGGSYVKRRARELLTETNFSRRF